MQLQLIRTICLMIVLLATTLGVSTETIAQEFQRSSSWRFPTAQNYGEQLASYLEQQQAPEDLRESVEQFWQSLGPEAKGPELLDHLLATAGRIDSRIADYHLSLQNPLRRPTHPQDLEWLTSDVPGWMQDTVRLACGRAYAQRDLYDEALELMVGLDAAQVCDPSTLLFYQAICQHHLLKQEACLNSIDTLLEQQSEVPARFLQITKMMKADIEALESDSLDEVARLMRDVERRLELGRAGKRVRDEEQEIIDKLQKMIDDAERKQQQQQQQRQKQQQQQQQQSSNQSQPMDESQVAGNAGGPGDVKQKGEGDRSGWGNLPPAQRQEALQRLTEDLPSHYRDVIEGYFRQLSQDR